MKHAAVALACALAALMAGCTGYVSMGTGWSPPSHTDALVRADSACDGARPSDRAPSCYSTPRETND